MIVCQCTGVTDRAIRKAIRDGARNRRDVARSCGAGICCGGCVPEVDVILEAERERERAVSLTALELAAG
ncbi:MAG TPA: (2Fe-2S)-binding protein [Myxococcota bacterium]|jgi:bacterioferritin-associated ferredoxin|nr:(2Fe-2S)-binding protein [Myxococcota bacterium]